MDLETISLLLVEDNRKMAELIRAVLGGLGLSRIELADRAGAAWARLRDAHYDLVMIDRRLGEADGLELVRRLRRLPGPAARTPVILVTASGDLSGVTAARDAGVDEFLVKPFTVAAMSERLASALHRRRPFICSGTYVGPDRRRRVDPAYRGAERRRGAAAPGGEPNGA